MQEQTKCNKLIEEGLLLCKAKQKRIEKAIADGSEISFENYKAFMVNTNNDISEVGHAILEEKKVDIAIIWSERRDKVIISLRSKDVDVAKVAQLYGGGGHPRAAGFEKPSTFVPW